MAQLVVTDVATLRTVNGAASNSVLLLGYYTANDGGGGEFYYSASGSDDGATQFKAGTATGVWKRLYSGELNVRWFGAKGDGAADDTAAFASAVGFAASSKQTLFVVTGTYFITSKIGIQTYLHMRGAGMGKTNIKYDTTFSGTGYMFEDNGSSFIEVEGITFTGSHDKRIDAFLGFNSYPNTNREINVHDCEFKDAATYRAINLGNTDDGSSSNTDVYIRNNYFHELYETGYQNVTADNFPDAHTCKGINMQDSTRLIDISYNRFENISSDGIFGFGQPVAATDKVWGNCNIHHNIFYNTWMGVEINGGALGYNQTIESNYFYWMRCNSGFAISTDCYNCKISKNFIYLHDRSAIECTSIGGSIDDNTIVISPYVTGEGFATDTSPKADKLTALQLYGYANTVSNNKILLQYTGTNGSSNTPNQYKGIQIVGKNTDPSTQPNSYNGITDYSADWFIKDNYIENPTGHAILADVAANPARNVYVTGNIITSRYATESMIEIHGYNWLIEDNIFDMTGSTPGSGVYLVGIYYLQNDDTLSVIKNNFIINDAWGLNPASKYSAHNNSFKSTAGVEYLLYPAPTVTQTQRAGLTGKEGMVVYQTDGSTPGLYLFISSAWKKFTVA